MPDGTGTVDSLVTINSDIPIPLDYYWPDITEAGFSGQKAVKLCSREDFIVKLLTLWDDKSSNVPGYTQSQIQYTIHVEDIINALNYLPDSFFNDQLAGLFNITSNWVGTGHNDNYVSFRFVFLKNDDNENDYLLYTQSLKNSPTPQYYTNWTSVVGDFIPYSGNNPENNTYYVSRPGGFQYKRVSVRFYYNKSENQYTISDGSWNIVNNSFGFDTGTGSQYYGRTCVFTNFANYDYNGYKYDNDSPYADGGTTEPDPAFTPGTWTLIHDTIDTNPTIHTDLDAQLYRVYLMTKNELANFSYNLWNPNILQAIGQHLSNPTDLIISLISLPYDVKHRNGLSAIQFNWIPNWMQGVSVNGYLLDSSDEYDVLDLGTRHIDRFSGTFYDYFPYSTAQLYLPYIGFVPLKINEILDTDLEIKYNIHVPTGEFVAIVTAKNKKTKNKNGQTITYNLTIGTYAGNMSKQLTIARQDMINVYKAGIDLLAAGASAIAGFAGAAGAVSAGESALLNYQNTVRTINSVNSQLAGIKSNTVPGDSLAQGMMNLPYLSLPEKPTVDEDVIYDGHRQGLSGGQNAIDAVSQANATIVRSGSLSGAIGRCSPQEAFIIISLPHQNVPLNQKMLGYSTNTDGPLNNYKGYTEVRDIRLHATGATSSELSELEEIVRGGIVIDDGSIVVPQGGN